MKLSVVIGVFALSMSLLPGADAQEKQESKTEDPIEFEFKNEDLHKVLEAYSKSSGQNIIIDATVRGKITILNPDEVPISEAFHQLSTAMALKGYAILQQGDALVVRQARDAQRSLHEVSATLPALKPERMASWVVKFKNISAEKVNRELRILPSKDGEISISSLNNQMILTDWTSNLHRVAAIIQKIDLPTDASAPQISQSGQGSGTRQLREGRVPLNGPSAPLAPTAPSIQKPPGK